MRWPSCHLPILNCALEQPSESGVASLPAYPLLQDCQRLFLAFAAIRRRTAGQFHPCNYDVSDVVSGLVLGVHQLSPRQLAQTAAAAAEFDWPLYRSPVWVLDCVAQEALRR